MIGRYRALVELALAGAALVGAGVCWANASQLRGVAPVAEGQPYTTALVYDPQLLLLTMVLAIIAGVFAVVGMARLLRSRALRAR